MNERTKYVVGFAFDQNAENVVLIRKLRPAWQTGLLNGVGGHVEDFDETLEQAMSREFFEETGVLLPVTAWDRYATITQEKDTCAVFRAFTDDIRGVATVTDEEICTVPTAERLSNSMTNLAYLIPMALDPAVTVDLLYHKSPRA